MRVAAPGRPLSEAPSGRGRLRVYLGMAPGVGKTYRMLEEGHRRLERGTDLVVGFAEPHGRPVTAALLDGLESVARLRTEHRGVVVEEMDTEAVLARKPAVALVDELAHSNVPGSPRDMRWQDVGLIQDRGIHVISTMNVQHLDSMADAVATITGVPVNERLPDRVLEGADEIELVDMTPHALRQRFRHGDVYPPERADIALDRFFTEGNLTALRELALRLLARRVEGQLERGAAGQGESLSLVTERVMVLVGDNPAATRAVRRAAALASSIHAALVAVVVETPEPQRRSQAHARHLREALDDAVDLGADVVRVQAPDEVTGLERIARARRATHVVVPHRERQGLRRRLDVPLSEQLLERLPEVEVHLVGGSIASGRGASA